MYLPDDRGCEGSGGGSSALPRIVVGRDSRFDAESLPLAAFSDALSGSQPCGGFLHPAAALLHRVLRHAHLYSHNVFC